MKLILLLMFVGTALMGCTDDSDNDNTLSDEAIAQTIECSNLTGSYPCTANLPYAWGQLIEDSEFCTSVYCFEDRSPAPQNPGLTRWRQDELIPVYYLNAVDARFSYALDKAESIIGYPMFDRKGVIELDISDPYNIDYSDVPTEWGFIWSQGTVSGSCSSGTVSQGPLTNSIVGHTAGYDLGINKPTGEPFAWINLDSANPDPNCTTVASNEVSLHELAHALGMGNHFEGFGNGAAFNSNAERVLRTMYSPHNPPGQPYDSLYIEK